MKILARWACFAVLCWPAMASAGEHRRVELSSGRVLLAEIAATRSDGLDLRTPQGVVAIRFDEVQRIDPVDQSLFDQQPPMRILQLPASGAEADAFDAKVRTELEAIPFTRVQDRSDVSGQSANLLPALLACKEDAGCVAKAAHVLDVDVVFLTTGDEAGRWLRAVFPGAPDANGGFPVGASVRSVVYELLRLDLAVAPTIAVPAAQVAEEKAGRANKAAVKKAAADKAAAEEAAKAAEEAAKAAEEPTPVTRPAETKPVETKPAETKPVETKPASEEAPGRLRSGVSPLSLSPIPGLPAFRAGDTGRGLAAIAITVPVTAAAVFLAGSASEQPWGVIGIGAATWWVTSVVCNRSLASGVVATASPVVSKGALTGARASVAGVF